nr:E3 ubiquitin-protein ligase PPP1R11-like [Lepeophtheirus salmonis]
MSETVTNTAENSVTKEENSVGDHLKLRLRSQRKRDKKVNWEQGTVDNEGMGKKKSKCCCIYKKPRTFGESSSEEDEDECQDCIGHIKDQTK